MQTQSVFSEQTVARAIKQFTRERSRRPFESRLPLTADFEPEILFSAASLSALMSAPGAAFRFKVSLGVERNPLGDFRLDYDTQSADLLICRAPRSLLTAPVEFRAILTLYYCTCSYTQTILADHPDHDFGAGSDPARRMLMDALAVSDEAREAARRALWN